MTDYTFLMPCLNEEETILFCIDEIQSAIERLKLSAEILVADNGSSDSSVKIALASGARVVNVSKLGYGSTIIAGIKDAKGKYIIMGDSDGSYDFAHPELFISELEKGAKLVVGDRFLGGIEKGAMPFSHRLGVPFLSFVANLKFKTRVRDFHCGMRAFERESALSLRFECQGMEFATEMIAKFSQKDLAISQVPTPLRRDKRSGKSHIRTIRDGFRHLRYILFKKAG